MSEPMTAKELADARALVDACPAGPWHWLCDPKRREVRIEATSAAFGRWFETVVDFCRYGMSGAAPRFRRYDPEADEPGDMVRADFISVPFPGREHHADWARNIVHPVGRLMVEARTLIPQLLDEVERLKQDARETLFRRRMAIDNLAHEIGQRGAENVEEIAARAAAEIARLRAEVERLQTPPVVVGASGPEDVELRHFVLRKPNEPWDSVVFDVDARATREQIEAAAFEAAAEYVDYGIAEIDADGKGETFEWKGADET